MLLLFFSLSSAAQNGWFLAGSTGIGVANIRERALYPSSSVKTGILSFAPQITAGYRLGHLRFSAGLAYYRTGYTRKKHTVIYAPPTLTPYETDLQCVFRHLAIPLTIGSELYLSDRLTLLPHLGTDISFNLGETLIYRNAANTFSYSITNTEFHNTYHSVSLIGNAGIRLEYKIGRVSLFAGPAGRYMLGDFLRKPYNLSLHPYGLYFNTGLIWFPGKSRTAAQPVLTR